LDALVGLGIFLPVLVSSLVDTNELREMKGEYYQTRKWDATTGLQTRSKLEDVELWEVTEDLGKRGLLR
jgi:aldehyde:ferredoxin oxidoreductase